MSPESERKIAEVREAMHKHMSPQHAQGVHVDAPDQHSTHVQRLNSSGGDGGTHHALKTLTVPPKDKPAMSPDDDASRKHSPQSQKAAQEKAPAQTQPTQAERSPAERYGTPPNPATPTRKPPSRTR